MSLRPSHCRRRHTYRPPGAITHGLPGAAAAPKLTTLPPPRPYPPLPAAGLCNSTATQAAIAKLRVDLLAREGATSITIFCYDELTTGGRRLAQADAVAANAGRRLAATASSDIEFSYCTSSDASVPPVGTKTGTAVGCIPIEQVSAPVF